MYLNEPMASYWVDQYWGPDRVPASQELGMLSNQSRLNSIDGRYASCNLLNN